MDAAKATLRSARQQPLRPERAPRAMPAREARFCEQFPDRPNPQPRKVLEVLLCDETGRDILLNVLSKGFRVPALAV